MQPFIHIVCLNGMQPFIHIVCLNGPHAGPLDEPSRSSKLREAAMGRGRNGGGAKSGRKIEGLHGELLYQLELRNMVGVANIASCADMCVCVLTH